MTPLTTENKKRVKMCTECTLCSYYWSKSCLGLRHYSKAHCIQMINKVMTKTPIFFWLKRLVFLPARHRAGCLLL